MCVHRASGSVRAASVYVATLLLIAVLIGIGVETGRGAPILDPPLPATPNWTAEGNQASANFGMSAGSAGDVNGDGYSDVIVGAPRYDNGETNEGRVFVYHGSAENLSAIPAWTVEGNQENFGLGWSVAGEGDVNGDGYSDVIVGRTSREFAYLGSAAGLAPTPAWTAESGQAGSGFYPAANAGDVNGDGYSDIVIGAAHYENGEEDEGRAFLYLGSAAGLATAPAWTAEGNQAYAEFGFWGLAGAGDVNGDGYSDVLISAVGYSNGEASEGRVFLYLGSAAGLATAPAWTAEGNQAGVEFGRGVASAGDVNGDGYSDVVIGANLYYNGQVNEGRAFLYLGSAAGLAATPAWTAEGNLAEAYYGWTVGGAGDVNADGYSDVVIGSVGRVSGQPAAARAFLYLGSAAGLAPLPAWTGEFGGAPPTKNQTAGDVNGDGFSDVLISIWEYSHGEDAEGGAFVFHGRGGTAAIEPGAEAPAMRPLIEAVRPNPFAPRTAITYMVGESGRVRLVIYNAAGRPVTTLVDGAAAGGRHVATWDGRNDQDASVAAGVYFARLTAGSEVSIAKLVRTR